jgi:hypothetical protein
MPEKLTGIAFADLINWIELFWSGLRFKKYAHRDACPTGATPIVYYDPLIPAQSEDHSKWYMKGLKVVRTIKGIHSTMLVQTRQEIAGDPRPL